jgi:hypothetical protein
MCVAKYRPLVSLMRNARTIVAGVQVDGTEKASPPFVVRIEAGHEIE